MLRSITVAFVIALIGGLKKLNIDKPDKYPLVLKI